MDVWFFVLFVVFVLVAVRRVPRLLRRSRPGKRGVLVAPQRAQALDRLQASVWREWSEEADKRGLTPNIQRPRLLHTQWAPAPPELTDGRTRGLTGTTADMAGLVESFTALVPQRLVIIGPAGSGKSTLLLLFLLELCRTRERDVAEQGLQTPGAEAPSPVPVLFSLSSYDPRRRGLLDWLAGRLAAEYPEVGSAASARDLLHRGDVLPCLDGLDEVPKQRVGRVLDRIRREFATARPVILACRTEEYGQALVREPVLHGASVTEARELAFPHVMEYLRASLGEGGPSHKEWADLFGRLEHGWGVLEDEVAAARGRGVPMPPPSWSLLVAPVGRSDVVELGRRWTIQAEAVAAQGGPAREVTPQLLAALGAALTSPLTASLFTDLYGYADVSDETPFRRLARAAPDTVRAAILENAVRVLFDHRLNPDDWPDARGHLSFLARHLERTGRTDLAWWELSGALHHGVYGGLLGLLAAAAGGITTASAVDAGEGASAAFQLGAAALGTGMLVSWWGPDRVASWLDEFLLKRSVARRPRRENPETGTPSGGHAGDPRLGRTSTALAVGLPMGGILGFLGSFPNGLVVGLLIGIIGGSLVGVPAGLLGAGGPVRGPRWFRRGTGFLRRIAGGAGVGFAAGAAIGLLFWWTLRTLRGSDAGQMNRPTYVLASMLLFALGGTVLGLVSGFLRWLQTPAPADDSTSPRILLRGDRRLVAGWALMIAGVAGLGMGWIMANSSTGRGQIAEGSVLLVALVLWVPIAVRPWPRYVVARSWLWLRGDLPRDLMAFLEHAHKVSVLRQVGGVYQFRHKDVQEHLSRAHADAGVRS
ncbi:hypothetical protein [Streptomyces europaeiscabiei]|uniref:hypothetical protein n=1 Tax=Streptomyces europaeiscabiei TaxID=146819 RepID=UPI0029B3A515|nr:hypothetical protein [Streptomyces europaeiscabiei]MDX3585743.1 hypothetical protein [Streptomyces europaeiscabiei]MDX3635979.1 hypothetical protein [Streptomyces europaeiscabiei]MDX3654055.1 hypothetical protein [Streptomyces europaeiscabiei]